MKRLTGIVLALVIALSAVLPVFAQAEHNPATCTDVPVLVVRGMDFGGLYTDVGTEKQEAAIRVEAKAIVGAVFKGLFGSALTLSLDPTMKAVANLVSGIFEYIKMNPDGTSKHNTSAIEYPLAAQNYEAFCNGIDSEYGMIHSMIDEVGDHAYYFNYDWRIDPFVVADDINETVERMVKETGHDKINIACCSMGGVMTLAYLTEYGYDRVNRICFMSSTFCGGQVASDLLAGQLEIGDDTLFNIAYDATKDIPVVGFLMKALKFVGAFKLVSGLAGKITSKYLEPVNDEVLYPVFGGTLTFWALVQPEDRQPAIDFILKGKPESHPELYKKIQALWAMMDGRNELLYEMLDNGVQIAVVAHYDTPLIPVYEGASMNGDGILETYEMSGYATVAPYGKTLGDDYVAENPEYLSPDRVVDLSTAILPDHTYIIKGAPHVGGTYGTDYADFFVWLMTNDGEEFYAGVNPDYPRFMLSDDSQTLTAFN
ncbi:MAG: hypothetical protein IKB88_06630 [Clostridia bacterium]|nr:hypothetical protein [Clostridia bacterium]